jgi:hypothetical protein
VTKQQQGGAEPFPPPIADAAYHGILGDIVRAIAPHTEADPVGILAVLLSGVGNALGRSAHALVSGKPHHARLNVILVGKTRGGAKGSAQSAAEAVLAHAIPGWHRARRVTGLSTGEGLIKAVRDEVWGVEAVKKGGAVESVDVLVDAGVPDKRLWVIEEEFARVIKVMGREGNTLSAVLRDAWDGNNLQVLTKGTPYAATEPHITIDGHVTPEELRRYLQASEVANGFANRFLWFMVRRSQLLPDADTLDVGLLERWGKELGAAIQEASESLTFPLRRDEAAREKWHLVYPRFGEGTNGMLAAVLSRAEAQALRLSVLYAALDLSPVIALPHLDAALAVWDYCHNSAVCIFGDGTGDPVIDTVLAALQTGPLSQTEISNRFNRNLGNLDDTLELMEERGLIRRETVQTGGRPRSMWHLIPPVEDAP